MHTLFTVAETFHISYFANISFIVLQGQNFSKEADMPYKLRIKIKQ